MTAQLAGDTAAPGPRIALALGGGSARGLAHVVMLEAFDELGVKPVVIAGTSMGAICGAAYAAGLSGAEMRARVRRPCFGNRGRFLRRFAGKLRGGFSTLWSLRAPGVIDNVTLFEMLLPEAMRCDFAALKIPVPGDRRRLLCHRAGGARQGTADPGAGRQLGAAEPGAPGGAGGPRADRRRLRQSGALRRGHGPRRRDGGGRRHRRHPAPARRQLPRTLEAITGATQILFHSITREKLKSVAPDIFIRPEVGAFGALDYFKIGEILAAAEPAKEDLKHKLSQRLAARTLKFPQRFRATRNLLHLRRIVHANGLADHR